MLIWTKLFGMRSHTPEVHRRLGLERLDDRALPSVTLPDGTIWMAPMLPPEQPATIVGEPFAASNAPVAVIAEEPIDNPFAPQSISGTIKIGANSTSSAEKGKFTPKGGTERESTDDELRYTTAYNKQYDGPTEFKAVYTIVLKPDGSVDPDKSSITMTMVNFTDSKLRSTVKSDSLSAEDEAELVKNGERVYRSGDKAYIYSKPKLLTTPPFQTEAIKITEATFDKDGKLQSFKFKADKWYGNPPSGLIDKGIVGEVDVATGKVTYTAKYQDPYRGTIAIYVVEGTVK